MPGPGAGGSSLRTGVPVSGVGASLPHLCTHRTAVSRVRREPHGPVPDAAGLCRSLGGKSGYFMPAAPGCSRGSRAGQAVCKNRQPPPRRLAPGGHLANGGDSGRVWRDPQPAPVTGRAVMTCRGQAAAQHPLGKTSQHCTRLFPRASVVRRVAA